MDISKLNPSKATPEIVARILSNKCIFGGQCLTFFSFAELSVYLVMNSNSKMMIKYTLFEFCDLAFTENPNEKYKEMAMKNFDLVYEKYREENYQNLLEQNKIEVLGYCKQVLQLNKPINLISAHPLAGMEFGMSPEMAEDQFLMMYEQVK